MERSKRSVEYGDLSLTNVQPPTVGAVVESGYVVNGAWLLKAVGRAHQALTTDGRTVVSDWEMDVPTLKHDRVEEEPERPDGDDIAF